KLPSSDRSDGQGSPFRPGGFARRDRQCHRSLDEDAGLIGRSTADLRRLQHRRCAAMTNEETVTPDRMNAFSDGVFAVIITIRVLDLRPPKEASFGALLELWPTAISYAISYLFIAIVWVN